MYRHIIVGRGLIGSAAARHLSAWQDGVAVVGPDEPEYRLSHDGVFASHYDEGRLTRIYDPAPEWSLTAARSIARYPEIEAESGVDFFTSAGYLGIVGSEDIETKPAVALARENGGNTTAIDASTMRELYPFLSLPNDCAGIRETETAGYVSPRSLVRAQTRVAEKNGAEIIRAAAKSLDVRGSTVAVTTDDGRTLEAERVLIATGGYTDACKLLPRPLALTVYGRTVVLFRVTDAAAEVLEGMPTIIDKFAGSYILPPIRYPDGHAYVKIGIGTEADTQLKSLADLDGWFKSTGSERNRIEFTDVIERLIPVLKECPERHTDTCVTTYSKSGLPYIDFVAGDHLAVAVAGNGKGAKGSDDWGYAAARLMEGGEWDHPIPRYRLKASFA
ncbi:FAD-binding oxidoreductase [Nisaea acidiphila]|uniref:FAD-binding oxidoreductase n=1 Tax=Nisaea acidiphila TaxID=1862145 RepID=A0A9J7ATA0_9PROT|nr:FAD-binding oxidoreductase [Nisaea acidiphila]UUX50560.1 FAD-binding oxidoreductase [Nisaea acidiphila]